MVDRLGETAAGLVADGALVGLGSGHAAEAFVRALAARVRAGLRVVGVATSEETAHLAVQLGIPVAPLGEAPLDLTIDGADEVDPRLDCIKGYGGALVRERIVAAASRRQVILVGPEKLVPVLGSRGRLPVEIVPFARPLVVRRLEGVGLRARLREEAGAPFVTDNGHHVLDCAVGPIPDPPTLERAIRAIPGVVDTGLFLGTASEVLVGDRDGVRRLIRR